MCLIHCCFSSAFHRNSINISFTLQNNYLRLLPSSQRRRKQGPEVETSLVFRSNRRQTGPKPGTTSPLVISKKVGLLPRPHSTGNLHFIVLPSSRVSKFLLVSGTGWGGQCHLGITLGWIWTCMGSDPISLWERCT